MVVDPLSDLSCSSAAPSTGDELLSLVQKAAHRFLERLDRAACRTDQWQDGPLTEALVDVALSELLQELSATNCWGEANRLPSSELWRIAGPMLEVGWLQHRARTKPLGYAGDHLMLQRICEQFCCEHPLGRAFDAYFQSLSAPEAVRNRTRQAADALVDHFLSGHFDQYHAVSLGSGPGLDMHRALTLLPTAQRASLRLTLLDLDPHALDAAQTRLEPLISRERLSCVRTNLYRLPQSRRAAEELGSPQFIVCTGFFDYLTDAAAVDMLKLLWQRLAPGGMLLIGNFAPHNPSRAYMEWIGNWYLIYRTAAQLEQLAQQAGLPPGSFSVGSERTGTNLFLRARK